MIRGHVSFRLVCLLLGMLMVSCSATPRFTRHVESTGPRHGQVNEAGKVESSPAEGDYQAGDTWRTQASWYGHESGRKTASGEPFRPGKVSAAHRDLPFGTWLQVCNLATGKCLEVRVNDRGPFKEGRELDLSREAARRLGYLEQGTTEVKIRILTLP